jgi:hypothetical protein
VKPHCPTLDLDAYRPCVSFLSVLQRFNGHFWRLQSPFIFMAKALAGVSILGYIKNGRSWRRYQLRPFHSQLSFANMSPISFLQIIDMPIRPGASIFPRSFHDLILFLSPHTLPQIESRIKSIATKFLYLFGSHGGKIIDGFYADRICLL